VAVVPSLRSVLSGHYRVNSITIVQPYLSALRTKDGKLLVVPSLLASSLPAVIIGRITLQDGVVELFDATVARPPLKIRLEQIQATVRDVVVPALKGRSRFDLTGVVKGVQRDGRSSGLWTWWRSSPTSSRRTRRGFRRAPSTSTWSQT
jgi:hypothetical protein